MGKWIGGLLLVAVVGYLSYDVYLDYRAGYLDLPELDRNSYAISFKNGMRAIVVDPEISDQTEDDARTSRRLSTANPDRKYLGFPFEIPSWFEDTWSYCHPPTDDERAAIERDMTDGFKRKLTGARFEAVCKIEADGESIWRGLIYSVPKQ